MERKVNLRDISGQFYQYALSEHEADIRQTQEDASSTTRHFPVYVNFLTLSESCPVVADLLRTSGSQVLPALDQALSRAARHLYGQWTDQGVTRLSLKLHLHARLVELPICAELHRTCVPRIEDEAQLLCMAGTVVRTGLPHLLETAAHYSCNKCGHKFTVMADYAQSYQTERPLRCPNPTTCRGGSGFASQSAADAGVRESLARDYQEIRLQEQVQKLDVGKIPRGICVVLEDDLVDSCKSGDDVIITGTVRQRWRSAARGCRPDIEMTLHANRVFVNNEQRAGLLLTDKRRAQFARFWRRYRHAPLLGRNQILRSFCSQIYGMYVVKLALALTLVGGVRRTDGSSATRGEPHLLLIGDPGTGKSQLLKYAARLCPRSVLTTGTGSTSAGLTCAAVKEGPEWQLEAGALVLADGGVCCIDEFNSIREADKTSIHEAMEQQTISVAKAGMVCKLNTRCSILAAANPRRPVDWLSGSEEVLSRLGLGSPLISRFDLILVLKDARSEAWDKLVSGYILEGRDPLAAHGQAADDDAWPLETLQAYLAHVRTLHPEAGPDAVTLLQTYYQSVRAAQVAGRARSTVRLLESLLRLTQAHARLRCSPTVDLCDAVTAVTLMEASLGGLGGGLLGPDGVGHILHTAFPDSPRDEYRAQCELILGRLGLDTLLDRELRALDQSEQLAAEDVDSDSEDQTSLYVNAACSGAALHRGMHGPSVGALAAEAAVEAERGDAAVPSSAEPSGSSSLAAKLARRRELGSRENGAAAGVPGSTVGGTDPDRNTTVESGSDWTAAAERSRSVATVLSQLDERCRAEGGAADQRGRASGRQPGSDLNTSNGLDDTVILNASSALGHTLPRLCGVGAGSETPGETSSLTRVRPVSPARGGVQGTSSAAAGSAAAERPVPSDLSRFGFFRAPSKQPPLSEQRPAGIGAVSQAPVSNEAPAFNTSLDSLALDMEDDDFESSLRDKTNRMEPPKPRNRRAASPKAAKTVTKTPRGGRAISRSNRSSGETPGDSTKALTSSVRPSLDPDARPDSVSLCNSAASSGHGPSGATPGRRTLSAATLSKLARFSADADDAADASAATRPVPPEGDGGGGGSAAEWTAETLDLDDDLDLDFEWPSAKRVKL